MIKWFEAFNMIDLIIGIPSYNGANTIGISISSIINQVEELNEEIEVLILDNASEDETQEVIKSYSSRYKFIKYFRNIKNVGADKNFELCIKRSNGKFVWLLSDDDEIRNGRIRKVLNIIKKNPYLTVVFVNYESVYLLNCNKEVLCKTMDEFFEKTLFKSTLVSSNVISKTMRYNLPIEKCYGTNWIIIGFIIEDLTLNSLSYIIPEHFVKWNSGRRWEGRGEFLLYQLELAELIKSMKKYRYKRET
jgi:glycosyltransferase involved in cell wall biosynthesis